MSDLPSQGLIQQRYARSVSGEDLATMGKRASAQWRHGEFKTLSDSVIATVKHAHLSPEQVKRVVEFTNTEAYLEEFRKEGQTNKVVDFGAGGPADISDILKELNDGSGGTVFDAGTGDYNGPPAESKTASAEEETALGELFKTAGQEYPFADPLADVIDAREKVAGAISQVSSMQSGLEIAYGDLADRMYFQVKQAALNGIALGDIAEALAAVAPTTEYIKVAFEMMAPRLLKDEVFYTVEQMTASMDKTASARLVNKSHPLLVDFGEFCTTLHKLAELRGTRTELDKHYGDLTAFLKTAGEKIAKEGKAVELAKKVQHGANWAGEHAGNAAQKATQYLAGGKGEMTKKLVGGAVKLAPAALLTAAGIEAVRQISNRPTPQKMIHGLNAHLNPLSQDWDQHSYNLQSGGGGGMGFNPYGGY